MNNEKDIDDTGIDSDYNGHWNIFIHAAQACASVGTADAHVGGDEYIHSNRIFHYGYFSSGDIEDSPGMAVRKVTGFTFSDRRRFFRYNIDF